jgi:hypothetical protein
MTVYTNFFIPSIKKQRAFQKKLIRVLRAANPVQQSFNRIAREDQVEILLGFAGSVEQTRTY